MWRAADAEHSGTAKYWGSYLEAFELFLDLDLIDRDPQPGDVAATVRVLSEMVAVFAGANRTTYSRLVPYYLATLA